MKTIDAKELNEIMEERDDWLLLDVLPPESYEEQHIPGAYNAPVTQDDFVKRAEKLSDSPSDTVIVYCADSDCGLSPKAAKELEERGFTRVFDFEGGIEAWKDAGFHVASDKESGNGSG